MKNLEMQYPCREIPPLSGKFPDFVGGLHSFYRVCIQSVRTCPKFTVAPTVYVISILRNTGPLRYLQNFAASGGVSVHVCCTPNPT